MDFRNGQVPLLLLVILLHTKEECHLKYQIFSKVEERGKHQGRIWRLLATWMAMPLLSIVLAVICFIWMSRAWLNPVINISILAWSTGVVWPGDNAG